MDAIQIERSVLLKYGGTDSTLTLSLDGGVDGRFPACGVPRRSIGCATASTWRAASSSSKRLSVIAPPAARRTAPPRSRVSAAPRAALKPAATRSMYFDGAWRDTPIYSRETLRPGDVIDGPAAIGEPNTTIVIEHGWCATFTEPGHTWCSTRPAPPRSRAASSTRADPVLLEIFNNLFMAIAEQMGVTLANTASSVNIKERLDFSCALFDAEGQLIANAPHMPVHLGSMGESVQEILRRRARVRMRRGDAFALNAPYAGGTHLPDVTVVMPVFLERSRRPAVLRRRARPPRRHRRHHAGLDALGLDDHRRGRRADRQRAASCERGVFLRRRVARALLGAARIRRATSRRTSPICARRSPPARRASPSSTAMTRHYGLDVVRAYMHHVQDNAEAAVRARDRRAARTASSSYEMDNGAVIRVAIRIDRAAPRAPPSTSPARARSSRTTSTHRCR